MSKSWWMIRGNHLAVVASAVLALAGCGQNGPTPSGGGDGGGNNGGICSTNKDCPAGEVCQGGTCGQPTACQRDADCNPGQVCNVLTGKCEAGGSDGGTADGGTDGGTSDGGTTDGGTKLCTPGTVQCTADGTGVETCSQDGSTWNTKACASATPVCVNASCLLCAPGSTKCNGNTQETCSQDGSSWNGTDCTTSGGTCNGGLCQVCSPGTYKCKDQTTSEACNSTGTAWVDTACANGICDSTSGQCKVTTCVPGSGNICQGSKVVTCKSDGSGYTTVTDCASQGDTCQGGQCISLCQQAAADNSYIGCEYWPVVLANPVETAFQSKFELVVSNPNPGTTATVNLYKAGSTTPIATQTVVGGAVQDIKVPWNAMAATNSSGKAQTQKGATAYKLTSSVPVTVYQFSPLSTAIPSGCTQDSDCPGVFFGTDPQDTCDTSTGTCADSDHAHSQDASLLLPAQIFGQTSPPAGKPASTYLAATLPHLKVTQDQCPDGSGSNLSQDQPSIVAIVASSPGTTTVKVHTRGAIATGGGVSAVIPPNTDVTFTLNQYDVLQLASAAYGTPTDLGTSSVCDQNGQNCMKCDLIFNQPFTYTQYNQSDLTGSIITSDHPIAVYGGANCRFVPGNKWACDHLEQQLFPFANWGSQYIGGESKPIGDVSVGDLWEIVAAVNGTTVSFDPAIPGVSNPTTLNAGQKLRFSSNLNFLVKSQDLQHPILVTQFLKGENARKATVGDPSMILAVPVEQYRSDYAFTTPGTVAQNWINVTKPTGAAVTLDGKAMSPPSGWSSVGSSGYVLGRVQVPGGTHKLTADQPVGLTVYGYDKYVSYGYPGGLDLKQTVIIVPGG